MALPQVDVDRLITDLLEVPPAERDRWLSARIPADASLRNTLLAAIGESTLLSSEQRSRIAASVQRRGHSPQPVPAAIGRYEVIRTLGEGGMGRVLLARDPNVGRLVAIKQVKADFENDDSRKRFWREARAAGRLRHPNIVTIYDVDEFGGEPFMVMEYVPGLTLAELIARRDAGSLARRLELIESLCAGLAAAHAAAVVHRDVKPSNVVVDEHGVLKILDFGIARPTALDTDVTTTTLTAGHAIMGTIGYIAPECFLGSPADFRCDMFAASVVAYELLTYDRPFGNVPTMMSRRSLVGDITPMRVATRDVPAEVERLVLRGLAVSPTDRFRDMTTMASRFAEARRELGSAGGAPIDDEAAGEGWSATQRVLATVVAVAAIGLAGLLAVRLSPGASKPEQTYADSALEAADPASSEPPTRPAGRDDAPAKRRVTPAPPHAASTGPVAPAVPAAPAPGVTSAESTGLPAGGPSAAPTNPPHEGSPGPGTGESVTTPPPEASASAGTTTAILTDEDETTIRGTIRAFEEAFQQMSTPELRRVHPTLTAESLAIFERRFLDSESYKVTFSDERLKPESPTRVTVECRVAREIVPLRGTPRRQVGRAAITLSKDADAWVIAGVRAPDWW